MEKKMSKSEKMLSFMKAHLGEWCCSFCASNSGQPAATFRELKKMGYQFEETAPGSGRWGTTRFCKKCGTNRSHYKLLSADPVFEVKNRITINAKDRKRILSLFEERDAMTGASISSRAEIDHKTPWSRLKSDVDASKLSDTEIKQHFQLLTRDHNLLKDRMCKRCISSNIRPPFLEISYWYSGDEHYRGTCVGCGWYDAKMWREAVAKSVKRRKKK